MFQVPGPPASAVPGVRCRRTIFPPGCSKRCSLRIQATSGVAHLQTVIGSPSWSCLRSYVGQAGGLIGSVPVGRVTQVAPQSSVYQTRSVPISTWPTSVAPRVCVIAAGVE